MQLNPVASAILVAFYLIASLLLVVLIGAAVYLLHRLNTVLESVEAKVGPVLEKADALLATATEKVDSIGGKTETILSEGEATAGVVHEKVERTATAVQQTVRAPIVGVNALAAGLLRGAKTFAALQRGLLVGGVDGDGRNRAGGPGVRMYDAPREADGRPDTVVVTAPGVTTADAAVSGPVTPVPAGAALGPRDGATGNGG